MLGISVGDAATTMQQAREFLAGGNAPNADRTEKTLHRKLMGGTPMLQNLEVGGNGVGGPTKTVAAPTTEIEAGQKKFTGRGRVMWSVLTAAVNMFVPVATKHEFSKKI